MTPDPITGLELRSEISADGMLTLSLEQVSLPPPVADEVADEVIVRIEAAPINPSDLGLLLGPASVESLAAGEKNGRPALTFAIPPEKLAALRARIGRSMPVGNEGAGTVIAAGSNAGDLLGRRVGVSGGGMYAQYRKLARSQCIPLPEGASAADGASLVVNPLTALGFVETMKAEGHTALIHTAAASNLGQMLQRICLKDGIGLVNIVRSAEQAAVLRGIGATHVLNSKDADFQHQLVDAIAQTGATLAFDAIGGGPLAGMIMAAMETALTRDDPVYNGYGSARIKQLYIYGALDGAPTVLHRQSFGFAWGIGGWLLFPFLQKAEPATVARMRKRVIDELHTTFASHYTAVISLAEALTPDCLKAYQRKATGEKFLIDPTR
jgi:NADPH2:quinone reductase